MKKYEFSKKLLILDYIIAGILIGVFFICLVANGVYTMNISNELLASGIDISSIAITSPFNLDIFGVLLGTWVIQLGVSSGAYYLMCKSDHKIQLPMQLVNEIPENIREQVDLTQIITTVLTSTDN